MKVEITQWFVMNVYDCINSNALFLCLVPEVLDVVLHIAEVQSVGQGLVVGQSLGR